MTNNNAGAGSVGEDRREQVLSAALDILNDGGLEAVTLRGVADRMGVRLNTVTWHIKTKQRLVGLMADRILAGCADGDLPSSPAERARVLIGRYRAALVAVRDGARLVAGTHVAEANTLGFADRLIQALLDCGAPPREAAWTCWTLIYFTLGLTQEQQSDTETVPAELARIARQDHYRALAIVIDDLGVEDFDDRFRFGVDAILGSAGTRSEPG